MGGRNFVYLGDGWALSAFHVGPQTVDPPEVQTLALEFSTGSFNLIKGQNFTVRNPAGSGLTEFTDLRLVRLNGDPGLPSIFDANPQFTIASQPVTTSTPLSQREVLFVGRGPTRNANQTHWNVTTVGGDDNDIWTEVTTGGTRHGYKATHPSDDTKRWGTNQIADEDPIFPGTDTDLRGTVQYSLGVGLRDVVSMVTKFDAQGSGGLTNEFQAVPGDSGSAVFYKRDNQWELIGIVNGQYSTYDNQPGPFSSPAALSTAVYGNYTLFADLSYYRGEILNIINAHKEYSIIGDVNLDGVVSGNGLGPSATDDVTAFAAGWMYQQAVGDVTSWKKGDLNLDGITNVDDFFLLRDALQSAGAGAGITSLGDILGGGAGVPEPSALFLAMLGAGLLAGRRRRR